MSEHEALVTGHVDLRDSDRIIRLLTPDRGRIDAVARHARASKRRFGGMLDLGNHVRVDLQDRQKLPGLVRVDHLGGPSKAREDLLRLAQLCYGLEVCARLAPEDSPAEKLFRLALVWCQLCEAPEAPGGASRLAFEAKALTFSGLQPQLVRCASCGDPLEEPVVFSLEGGGARHERCGPGLGTTVRWLAALEGLRRTPLADTTGGPVLPEDQAWLLSDFIAWQIGGSLKSRALLQGLG